MKKLLAFMFVFATVAFAQTNTPNIQLQIPPTGSNNWYIPLNYNFNKLDQLLSGNLPLPALTVTGPVNMPGLVIPAGTIVSNLGYQPLNPANNLSDVQNAAVSLQNLGGIGVSNIKGNWSTGTTYNKGDIVLYNGGSYISLVNPNTGNEPDTTPSDWGVLTLAGSFTGGALTVNTFVQNSGSGSGGAASVGAINGSSVVALNAYSNYESIGAANGTLDYMWFTQASGIATAAVLPYDSLLGWAAGASGNADTGIGRQSAGVIEVDGPSGAALGSILAANLTLTGTCTGCGTGSGGTGFDKNDTVIGYFTDLDTANAGGIAAASTAAQQAAVMQATSLAASCWSAKNGGAPATFNKSTLYPAAVSQLYIGSHVKFVASTVLAHGYTPSVALHQYVLPSSTASETNGVPAVTADYSWSPTCPGDSSPTAIGGNGVEIAGFYIYGNGANGGGMEDGVLSASYGGVYVHDNSFGSLGGTSIRIYGSGVNNSYDWNYATNVEQWAQSYWNNGGTTALSRNHAGAVFTMTDSEASHNQLSTGYGFGRGFHVGPYSHYNMFGMYVDGGGNDVSDNLVQTDEVGVLLHGQEQRFHANRVEYMSAELLYVECSTCIVSDTAMLSGALDSNAPVSGVNQWWGVNDIQGGTVYGNNFIGTEAGVDGNSYFRGCYKVYNTSMDKSNSCISDSPDAYGNGVKFGGGDLYSNGGGLGTPNNGISLAQTPTNNIVWVGDYSHILLAETTAVGITSFVGMADGNDFDIVSTGTDEILYPSAAYYGHPGVQTCDNYPLLLKQNKYYGFTYHGAVAYQKPCASVSNTNAQFNYTGNTAPSVNVQGTVSLFGSESIFGEPAHNINQLQSNISSGSISYSYEIEYWQAGAHFTTAVASIGLSASPTNTSTTTIYGAINNPASTCTNFRAYRTATNDSAAGGHLGLIASGSCASGSIPSFVDYATQTVTSATIPAASINTSGRLQIMPTDTSTVTHSTDCTSGKNELFIQGANIAACVNGTPYIVTTTTAP